MIKIFIIVGTRPEAIKMAPLYKCLDSDQRFNPILISTGQHKEMLEQVFDWFELKPSVDLKVMRPNQTLSGVLTRSIVGLDALITEFEPDVIVAQGDTTTVMASALSAFNRQILFGHVEAGLRTYDLASPFPEEGFRQMASRVARWHFAPTERSAEALRQENLHGEIHIVGNTVIDALMETAAKEPDSGVVFRKGSLCLITGHRRENHGQKFRDAFGALAKLAMAHPEVDFVYPVHLNPKVRDIAHEILEGVDNLQLIAPVPYPQMVSLMKEAKLIITDSGGIQEEAPSFDAPVLVMRDFTERQEAVDSGLARLVGTDPERLFTEASYLLSNTDARREMTSSVNPFGDGKSSQRIADIIASSFL